MVVAHQILIRMRNVSEKLGEKMKKCTLLCSTIFSPKIMPFFFFLEKYDMARQATYDNMIWRMCFACWITKATNTHSECVILIAFPPHQWLRERAWILRCTYFVSFDNELVHGFCSALPDVDCMREP
jgi:hypothetical protein